MKLFLDASVMLAAALAIKILDAGAELVRASLSLGRLKLGTAIF